MTTELEKVDENLHEKSNEDVGPPKRYYFENLKISLPQIKLSVFTSHKLPPDLKVSEHPSFVPLHLQESKGKIKAESVFATADVEGLWLF